VSAVENGEKNDVVDLVPRGSLNVLRRPFVSGAIDNAAAGAIASGANLRVCIWLDLLQSAPHPSAAGRAGGQRLSSTTRCRRRRSRPRANGPTSSNYGWFTFIFEWGWARDRNFLPNLAARRSRRAQRARKERARRAPLRGPHSKYVGEAGRKKATFSAGQPERIWWKSLSLSRLARANVSAYREDSIGHGRSRRRRRYRRQRRRGDEENVGGRRGRRRFAG